MNGTPKNGTPNSNDPLIDALLRLVISQIVSGGNGKRKNLVDVLDELSSGVRDGLSRLGNNDAFTPMGAIEAHALEIQRGSELIADSLESIGTAIESLTKAVREAAQTRESRTVSQEGGAC